MNPKKYYSNPKIKKALLDFASYQKDGIKITKAMVHDHKGWYHYQDKKRQMYQGNDEKAYTSMISNTQRTFYQTLNYFRTDYEPFHQFQQESWDIDGWSHCYAYMLSVDIDLKDPYSVDNPRAKEALEAAGRFTYQKLSDLTGGKVLALFSGNGIYIHIHPEFATLSPTIDTIQREKSFNDIGVAFDDLVFDIQRKFYYEFPEHEIYVKLDQINNKNRQIKAPFSLHKKFDYVVYPINPEGFNIDFKKYQTLSDDEIEHAATILNDFIDNAPEPRGWEQKHFLSELKGYLDTAEKRNAIQRKINKEHNKNYNLVKPDQPVPLEIVLKEPVSKAIWSPNEWGDGRHRRLALMETILRAVGWSGDDTYQEMESFTEKMGWHDIDLNHLFNLHDTNNPPNYRTIYQKGGKMFGYSLGNLREYLPAVDDLDCDKNKNPIKRIIYLAADEGIKWAVKQKLVWKLFLLDKEAKQTETLREIGEYLTSELDYFIDEDTGQLYIYNYEKIIYEPYNLDRFKNFIHHHFNGYLFHENEAKRIFRIFHEQKKISEDLIGFKNTLFNMRTFEPVEPTPKEIVTFQVPYNYNPHAKSEWMETKLKEILIDNYGQDDQGDNIKYEFFMEMFGYCFKKDNPHHKMSFIIGDGRNGKSTLVGLINAVFHEKVSAVPIEKFEPTRSNEFALQPIIGKLINIVYELPEKTIKHTGILKQITGEDDININRKHIDAWKGKLGSKIIGIGNTLPMFYDDTIALWDRVFCIELNNQFTGRKKDQDLKQKMIENEEAMEWLISSAINAYKKVDQDGWSIEHDIEKRKLEYQRKAYPALYIAHKLFEITDHEFDTISRQNVVKYMREALEEEGLKVPATRQQYYTALKLRNAELDELYDPDTKMKQRVVKYIKLRDNIPKPGTDPDKLELGITESGELIFRDKQQQRQLNIVQQAIWQVLKEFGNKQKKNIIYEVKDMTNEDYRDIDLEINNLLSERMIKIL